MTTRLASQRYVALVRELMLEAGDGRGAQVVVAKRLGISQPYVSQLMTGVRTDVGIDVVTKAKAKLGIDARFFDDARLGDAPSYHDHRARLETVVEYDVDQGHALTRVREVVEAFLASDEGAPYERFRGELLATYASVRTAPSLSTIRSYAHDLEAQERSGPRRAPPPAKPTEGARKLDLDTTRAKRRR